MVSKKDRPIHRFMVISFAERMKFVVKFVSIGTFGALERLGYIGLSTDKSWVV